MLADALIERQRNSTVNIWGIPCSPNGASIRYGTMAQLQRSILAQVSEPQREFFVWEVTTGQGDLQQGRGFMMP
jgi:hypothetical protein